MAEWSIDEGLTALFRGDPRITRDPYPFYARLRQEAPVRRLGPVVFVSTHAEARAAYLDHRRFVNTPRETTISSEALSLLSDAEKQSLVEVVEFERGCMSRMDGVDHVRVRSAAQPAFISRSIEELAEVTQELTDELLDELSRQETPDLVELAYQLPLLVISSMVGMPRKDADSMRLRVNDITNVRRRIPVKPELVRRAKQSLVAYRAYIADLVDRGARRSKTQLATAQLAAENDQRLTRDELVATYALILSAGHETTANLIANGVLALLVHSDQWQRLCDNPSLAPGAVEETLRYDAPVQISLRHADVDLELNGFDIPRGTPVWLLIGSANRDPSAFFNPDDVDITRHPNGHLCFGHGVHFCLGASLARLQGQVVFAALAQRFPRTELAGDPERLPRWTGVSMRGVMSLPVKLRA